MKVRNVPKDVQDILKIKRKNAKQNFKKKIFYIIAKNVMIIIVLAVSVEIISINIVDGKHLKM